MAVYVRVAAARSVKTARAHVRYVAFRSRELPGEERGAFDARSDRIRIKEFCQRLDDPVNRHPMATKAYKFIFSLSRDEFDRAGLTSWKPVVREAMANLEARWGRRLDWAAAEHLSAAHPHCHVVLRASATGAGGRSRQLRINPDQLRDVREEFQRIIRRERRRHRERGERDGLDRGPGHEQQPEKGRDPWSQVIDTVCRAIEQEVWDTERQARLERERQVRRRQTRGRGPGPER